MKIGIIGTGYFGLPTGVCLAELGNDVVCIDNNVEKIKLLQNGNIFLFEENLEELFRKNIKSNRIKFTTSMNDGVSNADVVIIANEKKYIRFS